MRSKLRTLRSRDQYPRYQTLTWGSRAGSEPALPGAKRKGKSHSAENPEHVRNFIGDFRGPPRHEALRDFEQQTNQHHRASAAESFPLSAHPQNRKNRQENIRCKMKNFCPEYEYSPRRA